jgi:hypothetical protein
MQIDNAFGQQWSMPFLSCKRDDYECRIWEDKILQYHIKFYVVREVLRFAPV